MGTGKTTATALSHKPLLLNSAQSLKAEKPGMLT